MIYRLLNKENDYTYGTERRTKEEFTKAVRNYVYLLYSKEELQKMSDDELLKRAISEYGYEYQIIDDGVEE